MIHVQLLPKLYSRSACNGIECQYPDLQPCGNWEVINDFNDFKAGARFGDYELALGWKDNIWPKGLKMRQRTNGAILTYAGRKRGWLDRYKKTRMWPILHWLTPRECK